MMKSASVSEKLVSTGLAGLQVATRMPIGRLESAQVRKFSHFSWERAARFLRKKNYLIPKHLTFGARCRICVIINPVCACFHSWPIDYISLVAAENGILYHLRCQCGEPIHCE